MPQRMKFFSVSEKTDKKFRPKKKQKRRARPSSHKMGYGKKWDSMRRSILIRDSFQCRACGRLCGNPGEAHVDHIIPKKLSGTNDPANLQVLCSGCHAKKTNREMKALALRRKPDRYSNDQPHHFS
jgi:5-methylcytosine-specific restriction endonuclease McrA